MLLSRMSKRKAEPLTEAEELAKRSRSVHEQKETKTADAELVREFEPVGRNISDPLRARGSETIDFRPHATM